MIVGSVTSPLRVFPSDYILSKRSQSSFRPISKRSCKTAATKAAAKREKKPMTGKDLELIFLSQKNFCSSFPEKGIVDKGKKSQKHKKKEKKSFSHF